MEARLRIGRGKAIDYMSPPVGQIVGNMNEETTVKQVIYDMLTEFSDAVENLNKAVEAE